MLNSGRRWLVKKTNPEYVGHLSREAGVSHVLAQILINRGIREPAVARAFLDRAPERGTTDPFDIPGMREAASRILDALRRGTRIFVHGDYDADGLTSTAIVAGGLRALGADVMHFIPNRFKDGYGFNPPAVRLAHQERCGLIVTVDCGVSSFEAVAEARSLGIDVVVTDHHEPALEGGAPILPDALAIVNPKLMGAGIGPEFSGAGVALKLIEALAASGADVDPAAYYDLAAIGTLADSVPLIGENRLIAIRGLADIRAGRRAGLAALRATVGHTDRPVTSTFLNFTIVPRINAAGRLADAAPVVGLLLAESQDEAMELARDLDRLNSERQKIEDGVLKEALRRLEAEGFGNAIVLEGEGWHEGVIGIVASKLVDRFYRPTVILSVSGEKARGSGRSIPEFDIFSGLAECSGLLMSFGGHKQAAGVSLRPSEIGAFRERFNEVVGAAVPEFVPTLEIDAGVTLGEITTRLVEEIEGLAPFGYGNPQPVLGARGLAVASARIVGNNHLRLRLRHRGNMLDAIGFDMGGMMAALEDSPAVDAAFSVSINEWEGRRNPQLQIRALREHAG